METNQGKKFGYARVSTTAQNEDRQIDLLTQHYGIPPEDIFVARRAARKPTARRSISFNWCCAPATRCMSNPCRACRGAVGI